MLLYNKHLNPVSSYYKEFTNNELYICIPHNNTLIMIYPHYTTRLMGDPYAYTELLTVINLYLNFD